ncbi:T9SS type A sorting domain-containing protein [Rhizosphaericola mali]|uniref:T9SS type A sorting domain-containing protein n=1 Tax=Rhizosphaericola mali TaxID=2545455 RepID=A0A5P2G704_9BACT|nr:T9SS type A sorting domain-containing protein [Rhizosphaericola mali]QES90049.1 T9SS type A sorting domain-containing protein [Rhizosphaericola mali]
MNQNSTLFSFFLFASVIQFSSNSYGQACATSERTINPNFTTTTTTTAYDAKTFSNNGWTGTTNNTGTLYLTSDGIQFSDNDATQVINQNMTNVNLLGNGTTLILTLAVNRANPSNSGEASLAISYANVTYASFSNPAGTPTSSTITLSNGASSSQTTFPISAATSLNYTTFTLTLPTTIPNNGILTFSFNAGNVAGDFNIKSASVLGCPVTISGSVLDDKNGLTDNLVNNTGTATLPTGQYVNLINNATSSVIASSAVSAAGAYNFSTTGSTGTQPSSGYSLKLTTAATSTTATQSSGWVFTGQSSTNGGSNIGTGGTGNVSISSIPTANATYFYGINSIPTATLVNKGPYTINQFPLTDLTNYRGILSSDANATTLSGTDAEDGTLGTGSSFKIVSLLNGTQLYYGSSSISSTQLVAGSTITNYTPSLLRMYSPLSSTGVYFTYQSIDQASTPSTNQTYTIYSSYPLPVVLSDFIAKLNNNIATLSWKGVTEINFSTYYIEASSDGSNFNTIGQIKGTGSRSVYSFQYNLTQPLTYFRLNMVDLDGTIKYSDIISLNKSNLNTSLSLYPNPTAGPLTINNLPEGDKNIVILDLNGRVLHSYQTSNLSLNIDLPNLTAGIYLVKIKGKNGDINTLKFIKK